ncbi:hypothetical protein BTUL_0159g00170 [Botrytis tulipae]|uniref:Uncharacterized protein n=1 Tax=Botrytis tulipae TaxID=87230 RepID=A0A4Z1EJV3_9HELO|nr:hypothetical protein BTUL_0159g00170 [Botrytis tulipae]
MSSIQPQQEFVIPRNRYVQSSNNTFQPRPNQSLMIRDFCVGRIVFLPQSSRGIESVRCILPHSPCRRPEPDDMAYEHYFVILDVFLQHNGEVKCYICQLTSQKVPRRRKHLEKRILIKGPSSGQPNFSLEQVYLEKGSMPKQSYICVQHVYQISCSLLRMTRVGSASFRNRISKESYYHLMQELDLKAGVYESTSSVIRFGATIRREHSGPSLNGSSSVQLGTPLPDRESSDVTLSSESSQALTILARPIFQADFNLSNLQHGTIPWALNSLSISISILPIWQSMVERNSDGHYHLHPAFTLSPQVDPSRMLLPTPQLAPSDPTRLTNTKIEPSHKSSQLHQLRHPPLDLKKAATLLSNPLSRFPHYLLKAILFIGTQTWGKLCLHSLVLLACYYTGTLKFGFLAIKGLDGWLDTLGNWSVRGNFDIVRVLGGMMKFLGRLTSPVLMRAVRIVGGLLRDVGLWAVRRIVRRR